MEGGHLEQFLLSKKQGMERITTTPGLCSTEANP